MTPKCCGRYSTTCTAVRAGVRFVVTNTPTPPAASCTAAGSPARSTPTSRSTGCGRRTGNTSNSKGIELIERLRCRNFQAHDHLDVAFDAVTTLIGASDVGKSSVVRALRWCALNLPRGTDFITHGADSCSVRLDVDGRAVVRRQGKENLYRLDDQTYRAFGHNVPDPIMQVLNLSDLNFQMQLDPPFWLGLPPPQLSRELNVVVNLECIDTALSNVAAEARRAKVEVEVAEERLTQAQKELDALDWVPEMLDKLGKIEATHARACEVALQRDRLESLSQTYAEAKRSRQNASQASGAASKALEAGAKWEAATERRRRLESLRDELRNSVQEAAQLREAARRAEEDFQREVGDTCPVCNRPMS